MQRELTTLAGGADDFTFVRHLRVAGTQREIGRALAEAASVAHGGAAAPRAVDDPQREQVRRRWFATHHPAHLERSNGVADHFGRDASDPSVAFDWVSTYDLPAGCSVAFYPPGITKDGAGVLRGTSTSPPRRSPRSSDSPRCPVNVRSRPIRG